MSVEKPEPIPEDVLRLLHEPAARKPLPPVVRCETLEEFAALAARLPCSCPSCESERAMHAEQRDA